MKTKLLLMMAFAYIQTVAFSQNTPYKTSLTVDGIAVAGSIGLDLIGLNLIKNKSPLTEAELGLKTERSIFKLDRSTAG